MSTASRGRSLEHSIRHMFEADGWSVTRGAGSKGELLGFKTDLIATKWTDQLKREVFVVGLQCKVRKA